MRSDRDISEPHPEPGLISRELFLSLYLPAIALSLAQGLAAPVLPIYAKSFEVSFGVASLVIILHGFGSLAATLPTGYFIDRIGRRPVLLAGPLLAALSSILTALAGSFPELLVYRFINGAATQMWQQSRLAMIADTGGDRQRGRMITWMMGMTRAGNLFSPALGGFIAAAWDIRVPFVLHGIITFLAILPSFKLAQETAPDRRAGRSATALRTRRSGGGESSETTAAVVGGEWRYVFRQIRTPEMGAFLVAQFLANVTRGTSRGGLMHLYAAYAYGVGPATLGVLSTANSVIGLPIGFGSGYVMDRFGRKATIVPGFSLIGISMGLMAIVAFAQVPFAVFVPAYFFMHAAQSLTGGNMQVLGSDLAPERARGRFFAIWRMIGEGGNAVSPVGFAFLAESFAYGVAFGAFGCSALSVALIVAFLVRETVGRAHASPARTAGAD